MVGPRAARAATRRARLGRVLQRSAVALAAGFAALGSGATAAGALVPTSTSASPATSRPTRAVCNQAPAGVARCFSLVVTNPDGVTPMTATSVAPDTGPWGGYAPSDLQTAYALPSLVAGTNQVIAVVDAYDNPNAESDLNVYRAQFGLGSCTTANGCFTKVNQTGQASPLPATDSGWGTETVLDIEMVAAVCPNCKIVLIEANSASLSNLMTGIDTAANVFHANAISNSWGSSEYSGELSSETHLNHPGSAITVSTGDDGYGTAFPSSSRYVTAVGGTSLVRDASPRAFHENTWLGAGSGCSSYVPKPSWQTDPGCSMRASADVSAVADPNTGVAVYDSFGTAIGSSHWTVMGGTSASAPIIAGVYGLGGDTASIGDARRLYTRTASLNDVTAGSNGSCSVSAPYLCSAAAGYDGPTGLGTPAGVGAFGNPPPVGAGHFTPVDPARILDTRNGTGGFVSPIGSTQSISVQVTGVGGVPATGVSAVVLNVTVAAPTTAGYLTAYPTGAALPLAANLTFLRNQTVSNLVVAKIGLGGKVSIFNSSGSTHVIADVAGWYSDGTGTPPAGGQYASLTPARVLDTRNGTGGFSSPVGSAQSIDVQVTGVGGVPATGVSAVVLNVTVGAPTAPGYLTVYPTGAALPLAANLTFLVGQTVPNLVVAKVGAGGKVSIFNSAGSSHVIADVAGWYSDGTGSPPAGGLYSPLTPSRVLDTRYGTGGFSTPVGSGQSIDVQVTGVGGVPASGVSAVVLNVTVTVPTAAGYLTGFPTGQALPLAANLTFLPGQTVSNLVVAKVGAGGKVSIFNSLGSSAVIADVAGWYS